MHPFIWRSLRRIRRMMPFACDITAIPPDQRASHVLTALRLLHEVADGLVTLSGGYAFRFAPDHLTEVADFVRRERLCCPFLTFRLELAPAPGPLWLSITGSEGVKEFLAAELSIESPSRSAVPSRETV